MSCHSRATPCLPRGLAGDRHRQWGLGVGLGPESLSGKGGGRLTLHTYIFGDLIEIATWQQIKIVFSRKRGRESWLLPELLKLLGQERPLGLCGQRCQGAPGTAVYCRGLCGSISATWPASVLPSLCPSCPSVLSLFLCPSSLHISIPLSSVPLSLSLCFCSSVHPSVLLVPLSSVPLSLPFILCSSIYPSVLVSLSSVPLSFHSSISLSLCPFIPLPFLSFCPLSFVLHL